MVVSFVVTSCCLCMLFFVWNVDHRDLPLLTPSFPTRRSSELAGTPDMPADPGDEAGLADWLAAARATAARALVADSRSRSALYQAVGKAWDFALVADAQPSALADLLDDAGQIGRASCRERVCQYV